MPNGPRGENSRMADGKELPACVVEIGVVQAIDGAGVEASGGLGLLRMGYPQQMKSEGVVDRGLLRMRNVSGVDEGVGVCVTVERIACIEIKQDDVFVDSELTEWNQQLVGAGLAPKH